MSGPDYLPWTRKGGRLEGPSVSNLSVCCQPYSCCCGTVSSGQDKRPLR